MQFTLALAALASTVLAAPAPQLSGASLNSTGGTYTNGSLSAYPEIFACAGRPYYQANYTCYDGQYLCPVINNRRTQACGDACYDPMDYACALGFLVSLNNGLYSNGTAANTTAAPGTTAVPAVRK